MKRNFRVAEPVNGSERQGEAVIIRRADIEIQSRLGDRPAILVDVTMTNPLSAAGGESTYERIGVRATKREKDKYKDYMKDYNIDDVSRAHLFFFGVETMGALGAEAKRFCLLLAKLAGGLKRQKITYIYQRLSVLFQGLRSYQVSAILTKYGRSVV